jgi:hypothetical protein
MSLFSFKKILYAFKMRIFLPIRKPFPWEYFVMGEVQNTLVEDFHPCCSVPLATAKHQ